MSDHPSIQSSVQRAISKLDERQSHDEWRSEVLNYFMWKYPVVYFDIVDGRDPPAWLAAPELTYLYPVGRRPGTDVSGYPAGSPHIKVPIIRSLSEELKELRFDVEEDGFYYIHQRYNKYNGPGGLELWKMECGNCLRAQNEFEMKTKPAVWAELERSISQMYLNKCKIPLETWNIRKLQLDYKWFILKIKEIHTGEGVASFALKLSEVMNMKFCNYDIDTYNSKMVLSREEILKMDKDPTTIINDLFSVIYHIGLNNFTSDSTVSGKLDKIYELQIWPSMDQTMAEINSASTMKHRIREQNQSAMGVIQANYTSNSSKQPTKSFINLKPIHKPMYKPQSRIVDKRCLICLGPHRAAECDREPTQCKKSLPNGTICTGLHHPLMHDIWMKIKGMNASKPSYQSSNKPNPKSAKSLMQMRAMEAEMVYERDIELDADQYDTLIALEAVFVTHHLRQQILIMI